MSYAVSALPPRRDVKLRAFAWHQLWEQRAKPDIRELTCIQFVDLDTEEPEWIEEDCYRQEMGPAYLRQRGFFTRVWELGTVNASEWTGPYMTLTEAKDALCDQWLKGAGYRRRDV